MHAWPWCVQMPEAAEVFTVRLVTASGAAALSQSDTQTSLTVAQNDDPISFTRSFVQVAEGEVAEFMVARGGQAAGMSCDLLPHFAQCVYFLKMLIIISSIHRYV